MSQGLYIIIEERETEIHSRVDSECTVEEKRVWLSE